MNESLSNSPEYSVSELSGAVKRRIEDEFGHVRVRGEVSGYRGPHSSGHAYFSLKDDGAKIDAVIWKGVFSRMRVRPEEGMEVIATGKLTTFPGSSKYQIVIEALEPAGIGALMALLEERRKKLAAEGLFDAARKQLLPYLPTTIGVVTSPTGAVIRDILHRLSDRFPCHVLVWPVRVQGEGSSAEVAAAIRGFNALPPGGPIARPDLIIVARGGGSLEDLWGFNDEAVVRAAAQSAIALISAVGHETDWTLIDHAADVRAPTPSAAAEMAVPVRLDLIASLRDFERRLTSALALAQERRRKDLEGRARVLRRIETLLDAPRQRLDHAGDKLKSALDGFVTLRRMRLGQYGQKLALRSPQSQFARAKTGFEAVTRLLEGARQRRMQRQRELLQGLHARFTTAFGAALRAQQQQIVMRQQRLASLAARLNPGIGALLERRRKDLATLEKLRLSLGYEQVLARGYALVRDEAGHVLRSAAQAQGHALLDVQFADGHLRVQNGEPSGVGLSRKSADKPRREKDRKDEPPQGSLF